MPGLIGDRGAQRRRHARTQRGLVVEGFVEGFMKDGFVGAIMESSQLFAEVARSASAARLSARSVAVSWS